MNEAKQMNGSAPKRLKINGEGEHKNSSLTDNPITSLLFPRLFDSFCGEIIIYLPTK